MIAHPVVYFLSTMSILKNSSEMYVIRHIITIIIGNNFNVERTFLTPFNKHCQSIVIMVRYGTDGGLQNSENTSHSLFIFYLFSVICLKIKLFLTL